MKALRRSGDQARIDRNAVTGHDLFQEVRVVFQVNRTSLVLAVKLGRESDALVEFVARIVEDCDVPAHVHVAVGIGPGIGYDHAETRWLKREDASDREGGRFQNAATSR